MGILKLFRLFTLLAATFVVVSCGETSGTRDSGNNEIRIASFSPALTRIMVDLGLGDLIVGCTPYCRTAPEGTPIVGDHIAPDLESLVRVNPSHILMQPPHNEVPGDIARLAESHGFKIGHWQLDTLDDIRQVISELPEILFQPETSQLALTREKSATLLEELGDILDSNNPVPWQGRVLLVHSVDPSIGIFGHGTYLDELLESFGCVNAANNVNGWAQLTLEDVVRLNPDAIVITKTSSGNGEDWKKRSGALAGLQINAIESGRVGILEHPDALLPSSSVIEVARELRMILSAFSDNTP